ncbi:Protein of unknown function, partial [Gryllus bimaculatus]
VCSRLAPHGA